MVMSEVPSHMQWWPISINSETPSDFIQTIRISGPSFILKGVFHSVAVTFLHSSSLLRSTTRTGIFNGFSLNENPLKIPVRVVERNSDEEWRNECRSRWSPYH